MPDYKGDSLTVDMDTVWEAGASSFPAMASAYHSANDAVYRTIGIMPSGDRSEFLPHWQQLRDQLTVILGNSSRNLEDTAWALREAMIGYAERDEEARTALEKALREIPNEVPPLPPTKVPPTNRYADPHFVPVDHRALDAAYSGNAPTVADLLQMARTIDDKVIEAELKGEGIRGQVLSRIAPVREHLAIGRNLHRGLVHRDLAADLGLATDASIDSVVELTVENMMENAVRCDPSWYAGAIAALQGIGHVEGERKAFGAFLTEVAIARDVISPDVWDSDAAREFRRNFLNAYEDIAMTQVGVADTLLAAVEGYQQAMEETYRSYCEAMAETEKALDAIIAGAGTAATSVATAVLSAAITVAGLVATGGPGTTAATFSLAGAGVSVGKTLVSVGGPDVDTVVINILQAIHAIRGTLEQFDQDLATRLESDVAWVRSAMFNDGEDLGVVRAVLPRPDFADDPTMF